MSMELGVTASLIGLGHYSEAGRTVEFAQRALPRPTVETAEEWRMIMHELITGHEEKLNDAYANLARSEARSLELQEGLKSLKQQLLDEANRRAEEAEALAEQRQLQQRIFYIAAAIAAAFILVGAFMKSAPLMIGAGLTSAFLAGLGAYISNLPAWTYHAFPIVALLIPVAMIWAYRSGLFKQPKSIHKGDYDFTPANH